MNRFRLYSQPVLALAAIVLAAVAQNVHTYRQADLIALIVFAGAIVLWLAALWVAPVALNTRLADAAPVAEVAPRPSPALAISVGALAVLTFLFAGGNEFTPDNLLAWGLGIATCLYTFGVPLQTWEAWRARTRAWAERLAQGALISPRGLALLGILLVSGGLNYWQLDRAPADLLSEHAEVILAVNDLVAENSAPIYFERSNSREPLEFYVTAALVRATGRPLDFLALKQITAFAGGLLVLGVWWLARELFDDEVALLAALFAALSKWTLVLARIGLSFVFAPLFTAFALGFLLRALKHQRRNDFLWSGLWLGVGLYGNDAFRLTPVLALVFIGGWFAINRAVRRDRKFVAQVVLMFALMLIVAMPLVRYATQAPEIFWQFFATHVLGDATRVDNLAQLVGRNFLAALAMFNWTGDAAWFVALPNDPALDYVTGGLFVLGVVLALYRWVARRESAYAFAVLGVVVPVLLSAFSAAASADNPSITRASGALPFVFLLAALPAAWLARAFWQALSNLAWGKLAALIVIGVIVAASARVNYTRYFGEYAAHYRQAAWNADEIASVLRGFAASVGDLDHAWIVVYPHWVDARNVGIAMRQIGWEQVLPNADGARAHQIDGANQLYILHPSDAENLTRLREIFPNGQQRLYHARTPDHAFVVFYAPGTVGANGFLGEP